MILHDITLSGFRTFADKVHVGPFVSNITVIHAPNGTGKTTLLDGLYHGLLESHAVTGVKAEMMMRSGGRDLVPSVSVDFETAGVRYRLEKRFLSRPEAKLSRFENGAYVPLSEGDAATAFPRELLFAKPSKHGAIKREEHFGLGAILWAAQGHSEIDAVSGDLLGMARNRLGGAAAATGAGDIAVAEMAKQWFTKFYSRANHESKAAGSADLPGLRKLLADAQQRFSTAQAGLVEIDRLRTRFVETAADKVRYAAMAAALDDELGELTVLVKAFEAASHEFAIAEATCASVEERYTAANKAAGEITRLRTAKSVAERNESVAALARDRAAVEEKAARARLAQAQEGSTKVAASVEAAERDESIARDATAFVMSRRDIVIAKRQLTEFEELQAAVGKMRNERIALNAPSASQMRALRKSVADIAASRVQLDAAVLHVEFSPEVAQSLDIISGTIASNASSSSPQAVEVSGSPLVEFNIRGVGTVRAHGPTTSAEAIREALADAEAKLAKLTAPFGTADMAELERRAEALGSLQTKLEGLEARLAARSEDSGTVEALQSRIANCEAFIGRLEVQYPDWAHCEPDGVRLSASATAALSGARTARTEAAAAIHVAGADLESHTTARVGVEAAFTKAAAQSLKARTQLESAENDGHDDDSRALALQELGLAVLGARQARDIAGSAIAEFADDPRTSYAARERKRDGARKECILASEAHAETRALLDAANAAGAYEKLVVAETEVADLSTRLRQLEGEAKAAKLLHETFLGVEADREAGILAPVRKRTAELYKRVAGAQQVDVHFTQDLTFDSLQINGVKYSQTLSGGEREQLHMVSRLALADLVTEGERQLVVLDDAMTYADPRRFARFLNLIEEFAQERMQFVIATCDKAGYLGLAGATFIDLEATRRAPAVSDTL